MSGQKPQNQQTHKPLTELPTIPDKLYFTIGEVSKLCDLRTHVLRYWEQEFSQLMPSKRRGNRRYYQRKDVLLIRKIRYLLYDQGYTIEGARAQLAQENNSFTAQSMQQNIKDTVRELEELLTELNT